MKNWHYRKQVGDAGMNSNPERLKDLGTHSIEVFVREVIQNNLDAAEQDKEVTVEFRILEQNKQEIESFLNFIGKEHIDLLKKSTAEAADNVAPYLKDCIEIIEGKKKSAFSIVVEETNCIGLIGPVRGTKNNKSHFDALMRKIEDNEAKKETSNTGGTWGKGSSIFTYTSMIWTWFSYTKLSKPWSGPNNPIEHRKRFIGRSMFAPFFDEPTNEGIVGDGWFCDTEKLEKEKIDAYPFINEKADQFAEKLGLNIRQKTGTTFYIPFFNPKFENENQDINLQSIKKEFEEQVLKNWFIPICNKLLTVKVTTEAGTTTIDKHYLNSVNELKFKLQLLDWYDKDCPLGDERFIKERIQIETPSLKEDFINKRTNFAKSKHKTQADLIIRVLDEDEDFKDSWDTSNKVALCRNKGMIINNEETIKNDTIRTESILLSGLMAKLEPDLNKRKHLDLFLAYSENPAHNMWCRTAKDYDRCFLDRFKGKRPKPEASINHLFNQIETVFRKLLDEDVVQKENKDVCSIFKKLARLNLRGGDRTVKTLFHMRKVSDEIDSQGRHIFTRRIISNSELSDIDVYFKSYIDSLEGEKDKDFEHLGIKEFREIEILNTADEFIDAGSIPIINLRPMEEIIVKIRSCKIDNNPNFKNVEPLIKAFAKLSTNE